MRIDPMDVVLLVEQASDRQLEDLAAALAHDATHGTGQAGALMRQWVRSYQAAREAARAVGLERVG